MIKIKEKSYQGDAVSVVIVFDLGAEEFERSVDAQVSQVLNMSVEQIKTWVRGFVANQRRQLQEQALDNLLDPLVDVDIEE